MHLKNESEYYDVIKSYVKSKLTPNNFKALCKSRQSPNHTHRKPNQSNGKVHLDVSVRSGNDDVSFHPQSVRLSQLCLPQPLAGCHCIILCSDCTEVKAHEEPRVIC